MLNDKVAQHYPEALSLATHMSIEHLLMHTSGMANYHSESGSTSKVISPSELINIASDQGHLFCPGTAWAYSNTVLRTLDDNVNTATGHVPAEAGLWHILSSIRGLENAG